MKKNKNLQWRQYNGSLDLFVNTDIYPQEPLYATCCVFMDNYYIGLDFSRDKKNYVVSLIPKNGTKSLRSASRIAGEFRNELLSNVLRYQIASRNQKIREAVVRSALLFSQPKKTQEKTARALISREKNA